MIDLTGQRFGLLTVIEEAYRDKGVRWLCRCDCGGERIVKGGHLSHERRGTISCGCRKLKPRRVPRSGRPPTHKCEPRRLYEKWNGMLDRCRNPNNIAFDYYGGRGITVCEEWLRFEPFRDWALANSWRPGLQIDRRDNDLGYYSDNCRFVTEKVNANNRRNTHRVDWQGRTMSVSEWAAELGMNYHIIKGRLRRGWPVERALAR